MASYFIYSVQLLLVFVAFVSAVHVQNNKGDEFVHQELIRLLSLPQKSERIPNVFKIQIGDKLMLGSFEWSSCNSSAPLVLNSLTISPDPIKLNGDVTVGFNGTANVDVVAGLNAKLVIKKKVAGFDVEIPCEDNIGSCTYKDVCGMIPPPPSTGCPPPLSTYKIPCECPFPKGVYNLPPSTFAIPPVPLPGWLASGDYSISVKAYSKSGANLACYNFKISLA